MFGTLGDQLTYYYNFDYYCKFFTAAPTGVLSYLPTPPLGQDMTQGQFLSGV